MLFLGIAPAVVTAQAQTPAPWAFAGADLANTRAMLSPSGPQQLNATTAANLKVKWVFSSVGGILATPTVEPGGVYVTDQAGTIYKLDPNTGATIWTHPFSYYTGTSLGGSGSRASPAIGSQNEIILGDTASTTVFAINRTTGALIWKTAVEGHPFALVHSSPIIYNGIVYVGVSSGEEGVARSSPSYVPTFRGSVVALSEATGQPLWKYYTVPVGYAGASIWNSQPIVFPAGHSVIVATGNNYAVPASVAACVLSAGSTRALQDSVGVKCLDAGDDVDSIVALDLTTGGLKWARKMSGPDTFNGACEVGFTSCPNPEGQDVDFASAPNLVGIPHFTGVPDDLGGASNGYLLGAGQKNGMYWALNPFNGGLFWSTFVGNGGIQWGTAINTNTNAAAYVAIDNGDYHLNNLLAGVGGVSQYWNAGSWGSIDFNTGRFNWQVPAFGKDVSNPTYGGFAPGALSYTNDMVFAASSSGYMVGLHAATSQVVWSYNTGGPVESAPAIFNDTLYWGAGGTTGKLYAFSIASTTAPAGTGSSH